jgi:thioredoxin-like negative regulator of GroEL
MISNADPAAHDWWVICLCAEWCGACRGWREQFEQIAAAHPDFRFAWVDIEDEAQAMGDVDIETFPTMLVAQGGSPRFFGPVQPSGSQVSRLLSSLLDSPPPAAAPADAAALFERLASTALSKREQQDVTGQGPVLHSPAFLPDERRRDVNAQS